MDLNELQRINRKAEEQGVESLTDEERKKDKRRTIRVNGELLGINPQDTVADILQLTDGSFTDTIQTTALIRGRSENAEYPKEDDYVPYDLSTVRDGDEFYTYRLRPSDRPAYGEDGSK